MSTAPRKHLQRDWDTVGGLSKPSKMPCYGYSIPASYCQIGSILRAIGKETTCGNCYTFKGHYPQRPVMAAMERRYRTLRDPLWIDSMATLISGLSPHYFRWHDSGDIQGVWHLEAIAEVARRTPNTSHWLPTREYKMVKQWEALYSMPPNLTIRLSAHKVDGAAPSGFGLPTSTVVTKDGNCNASKQGGKCLDCRACWDPNVANVAYPIH